MFFWLEKIKKKNYSFGLIIGFSICFLSVFLLSYSFYWGKLIYSYSKVGKRVKGELWSLVRYYYFLILIVSVLFIFLILDLESML